MDAKHKWIVTHRVNHDGVKRWYAYWSDVNYRKYSTWYYEPFETQERAEQWVKDIESGAIPFDTTSMTRTKY